MGRARSQQQPTVVRDFEVVFGGRRGSAAAQAARDVVEATEREALREVRIENFLTATGRSSLATLLVSSYRDARAPGETTAQILGLLRAPERFSGIGLFRTCTRILNLGDPALCPGLTAPMLAGLCDYFRHEATDDPHQAKHYGTATIEVLFGRAHAPDYYLRLKPLCAPLAALISHMGNTGGVTLGLAAARALKDAPAEAITGPLRCFVEAFRVRVAAELATEDELRMLRSRAWATATPDAGAALMLAELGHLL